MHSFSYPWDESCPDATAWRIIVGQDYESHGRVALGGGEELLPQG